MKKSLAAVVLLGLASTAVFAAPARPSVAPAWVVSNPAPRPSVVVAPRQTGNTSAPAPRAVQSMGYSGSR